MKHQIPAMLDSGGGAIVNMASVAGVRAMTNLAAYVAGKAAIIGLTEVAALDYADRGVRVNVVAPGPILTHHLERAGAEAQRLAGQSVPMGRIGTTARGRRRRAVAVLGAVVVRHRRHRARSTAANSPATSHPRCTARARAWPRPALPPLPDHRPTRRHDHDPPPPTQIHELGARWVAAEIAGDTDTLETMVTDDFRLVGPFGFILDKRPVARPLPLRRLRHHRADLARRRDPRLRRHRRGDRHPDPAGGLQGRTDRTATFGSATSSSVATTQWAIAGIQLSLTSPPAPSLLVTMTAIDHVTRSARRRRITARPKEATMTATIINPRHDLRAVRLVDPPPYGYLLFGATITPPKGPPVVRKDATRQAVLTRVAEHLEEVAQLAPVVRATGYRAVVIPPAARQSSDPTSCRHALT